jgi:putative phage-type endonuclease
MLTAEQVAIRARGVGASEVAAIVGVSPHGTTAHDVWLRKVGLAEERENSAMRWGRRVEATIADWYADTYGVTLTEPGTLVHPHHSWALATPDRIAEETGRLLEIKARAPWMRSHYGEPGTDRMLHADLVQVQWQMFVANAPSADLAVSFGTGEPVVYHASWDEILIEELIGRVQTFWYRYCVANVEPPATPAERLETLAGRYPESYGETIAAPVEAARWVEQYRMARKAIQYAERQRDEARAELCAMLGDAEGLEGDGFRVTWKSTSPRRVVDWKGLAVSLGATPERIAQATSARAGERRFGVKTFEEESDE